MTSDTCDAKPMPAQMLDLIVGYWVSKMIYVAARLGIADLLREGPLHSEDLARTTGAEPRGLYRLLRALSSVGIFQEDQEGRFELTPLAETLCSDRPDSMRDFALMMGESYNWRAWDDLHHGVTSGGLPFEKAFGTKVFDYLSERPEDEAVFARSMASISGTENAAITEAYDFSELECLVDVGGSGGHLLGTILDRHPTLRGVLFDLPRVVEGARSKTFLGRDDLLERVSFVGGDFFQEVPAGFDAYVMKYILHDWNDEQCVQILTRCREAMAPGGRVLAVDSVIARDNQPQWGKLLDINMMVLTGGRERTEDEFRHLFESAGLTLERVIPTRCSLSIVEGSAAG